MKIAIVKASTVAANDNRLDAGHYLGQVEGRDAMDRVEYYKKKADSAVTKLQGAIDDMVEAAARQKRMIDNGEVIPIQ